MTDAENLLSLSADERLALLHDLHAEHDVVCRVVAQVQRLTWRPAELVAGNLSTETVA